MQILDHVTESRDMPGLGISTLYERLRNFQP